MNEYDNQIINNLLNSSNNSVEELLKSKNFSLLFYQSIKIGDYNQLIQFIFSHFKDLYEILYSTADVFIRKNAFSIICSSNFNFREQLLKNTEIIKLLQFFPKSPKKQVASYVNIYMLILPHYFYDKNGDISPVFISKPFFTDFFSLVNYENNDNNNGSFSFSSLLFNNSPRLSLFLHKVSFLNLIISNIQSIDSISYSCMQLVEKSFASSYCYDMFYSLTFKDEISRIIQIGLDNRSSYYFIFLSHLIKICNFAKFTKDFNSTTIFLLFSSHSLLNDISFFLLSYKNFTEFEKSLFDFLYEVLIENIHSSSRNPKFLENNLQIYFKILEFSFKLFFEISTNSFLHNSVLNLFKTLFENSLITESIFWQYFSSLPTKILETYEKSTFYPNIGHIKIISKLISPFLGFSFPKSENFIFVENRKLINLFEEKMNDKSYSQKWKILLNNFQKIHTLSYSLPPKQIIPNNSIIQKYQNPKKLKVSDKEGNKEVSTNPKLSQKDKILYLIHHPFRIRLYFEDMIEFHILYLYAFLVFLIVILLYKFLM